MLGLHRDRWIPRTKGQLRGKCFHLMTSSCVSKFVSKRWRLYSMKYIWSYILVPETFLHETTITSHYGDIKWPSWRLELPVKSSVCSILVFFFQTDNKEKSKVRYIVPLRGESQCCTLFAHSRSTGRYREISNISRTKSPNLNVSRLVLQL